MKKTILLLAIMLTSFFSYSQTEERIKSVKTSVNQSSLIFEGQVISKGKSFRANNNAIYTPYDVLISKTFSGSSSATHINILMEGGEIEENGMGVVSRSEHGLNILLNVNAVFFCSKSNVSEITNSFELNEQVCYSNNNSVIKTNNLSNLYSNINELLTDLSSILSVEIPQKKSDVAKENLKIEQTPSIPYQTLLENYNTLINKKLEQYNLTLLNNINAKVLAQDVTLQLSGAIITGTTVKFLEFDVNIKSTNSISYLDNIPVRLSYNTNVFGTNVVGAGKITVTNGTSFNNTQYLNANNYKSDQSANVFAFAVGTDYMLSNPTRVNITPTYKLLAHVKMEISYCGSASANLTESSTALNAAFYTTSASASSTAFQSYTTLNYLGSAVVNTPCPISVFDFNTPLSGGKGDIITINGVSFGTTRGTGQVKFKDANAAGHPFIQKLDNIDYVSWNDTVIKIRLPSMIQVSGINQTPGSGIFIVKNNTGDSAVANYNSSFQTLDVHYSLFQDFNTTSLNKYRFNLKNANGLGGYTIRADTSISNHPDRKGCLIRAIKDWRCIAAINLVFGNDTSITTTAPDNITTMFFVNSLPTGVVASTQTQAEFCLNSSVYTYAIKDFDTKISRQFNFFYDTTGAALPLGMYDFYEVMVHEIGHGISLKHVIDTTQIMYRTTKVAYGGVSLPGASRRKLVANSGDADGVLYNVGVSPTSVTGQCTNFTSHQISNTACTVIGINEILKNKYDFMLYPNPVSSDKLNIKFNNGGSRYKITIYDSMGKIVFQSNNENSTSETNLLNLDVTNFSSGLYLINLTIDNNNLSQKFIKY